MTENDSIEIINDKVETCEFYFAEHDHYPKWCEYEFLEALGTAILALKEIQQYREIGTIEELKYFKDMKVRLKKYHANISVSRLLECFIETVFENTRHEGFIILTNKEVKDYETYCSIGTVEECREAVEKQKPKKKIPVTSGELYGLGFRYKCPNCGSGIKVNNIYYYDICKICGQKIINEESEEE